MKSTGIKLLILSTFILVTAIVLSVLKASFPVVFYFTVAGQMLLIFSVYKVLTDDYTTEKTFEDWYEDHSVKREER